MFSLFVGVSILRNNVLSQFFFIPIFVFHASAIQSFYFLSFEAFNVIEIEHLKQNMLKSQFNI